MQDLIAGIHRFCPEHFRPAHGIFGRAVGDGKPQVLLIACSDLGLHPDALIPANPEDLYVLQNAGNVVAPHCAEAESRGCGVCAALGLYPVTEIVVCGHSHCGVMEALLELEGVEPPSATRWREHAARTRVIVREHYRHLDGEPLRDALAGENVLVQLENLLTIPAIMRSLDRGLMHLHGWVSKGGLIYAYGPHLGQFVPLAQ